MTILIVDDSPVDAKMIQAIIIREDVACDFVFARNGKESLDIVQKQDIDIVVMDVIMPGINGFEAAKRIKEIKPEIKIVILTNAEEEIHPDKVRNAGVDFYTSKKLMDYTLIKAIRKILDIK